MKKFIIKVQVSQFPPGEEKCLIYNEDHSMSHEGPLPDNLRDMLKGRVKCYCWAWVDAVGILYIDRVVPKNKEPNW